MTLASAWITRARSPDVGLGESLDGEGSAGGIVLNAEDTGLGETLYIVYDAVSCPGANVQDVDVHAAGSSVFMTCGRTASVMTA